MSNRAKKSAVASKLRNRPFFHFFLIFLTRGNGKEISTDVMH
jgi:hypothetical protein